MECAAIALICPLFIKEGELFDNHDRRVATFSEISSPQQLKQFQPEVGLPENVIIDLLDWQVCTSISALALESVIVRQNAFIHFHFCIVSYCMSVV